jgi:hypothetical protein
MPGQRLQFLSFIDRFQPNSLDSQQSLAIIHSHGLSTWNNHCVKQPLFSSKQNIAFVFPGLQKSTKTTSRLSSIKHKIQNFKIRK